MRNNPIILLSKLITFIVFVSILTITTFSQSLYYKNKPSIKSQFDVTELSKSRKFNKPNESNYIRNAILKNFFIGSIPTTTTISSSLNPSFSSAPNNIVRFTANVDGSPAVNEGTVSFDDGGSPISGCQNIPLSRGLNTVQCTTSFTTEGEHIITATYSGTPTYDSSSNNITQIVERQTSVNGNTFCNTSNIVINDANVNGGRATSYPSNIFVSGIEGTIKRLKVTLNNVSHDSADDLDILLTPASSPFQGLVLVADAGGNTVVDNVTVTFDNNSSNTFEDNMDGWGASNSSVSSTVVNYESGADPFPAPAPQTFHLNGGFFPGDLASFNGQDPNGTWQIYVVDDLGGGTNGSITGGWCVEITPSAETTTTLSSDNNPSFSTAPGNDVNLTATITETNLSANLGGTSSINEGTVSFTDDSDPINGCQFVPVSNGQAICNTTFSEEGENQVIATYNGSSNFSSSIGSLIQTVNNRPVVVGGSYCNMGSITINNGDNNLSNPYPSNIIISGFVGSPDKITISFNDFLYDFVENLDILLVGPAGQSFVLVSDAGGESEIDKRKVTFDDDAPVTISPAIKGWGLDKEVSSKPVNYGMVEDVFPFPAPAGPHNDPGPNTGMGATLNSTFLSGGMNGTWSLYIVDDGELNSFGGIISNGWCVNAITNAPPPAKIK